MLGPRLREARRSAGLKQVELAVAIGDGYTQSMISMIECGQRPIRFIAAVRAARTLGVSLDYLAGLTDDPTPVARLVEKLADARNADHNM